MWFPDKGQWIVIWLGFVFVVIASGDSAAATAIPIIVLATALVVWMLEGSRRKQKANAAAEARTAEMFPAEPRPKPYADMTDAEKKEAELKAEWAHEDWKKKQK